MTDSYIVESGPQRHAVSLGVFRSEQAARSLAGEIAAKNIAPVEYGERQQPIVLTTLVIRDPREPVLKRLRELVPAFPGAEVRVGQCEKSG